MGIDEFKIARFSDNYRYIIDSNNNRVDYHHPKVVHVWPVEPSKYYFRALKYFYKKRGWKLRLGSRMADDIDQYSKKICTGKECLSFSTIAGATYKDLLEKRSDDEISIYYCPNHPANCQIGAFPLVWDTFARRLKLKNAVFNAYPTVENNYLGQGNIFAIDFMVSCVLGDIFDEAETTIKCLAKDKPSALKTFEEECSKVEKCVEKGLTAVIFALRKWAKSVARIPLRAKPEETPKILIFGGIGVSIVHDSISEFFFTHNIIPKVINLSDYVLYAEAELMTRFGIKRGISDPGKHSNILPILFSIFSYPPKEIYMALHSRVIVQSAGVIVKLLSKFAQKSGLIYDKYVPFSTLIKKGHPYASFNTYDETTLPVGRFIHSIEQKIYDGLLNVGGFNCQPTINSMAVIRPLSNQYDIPYAAIDLEGNHVSPTHYRLLENIVVQSRRVHEKR